MGHLQRWWQRLTGTGSAANPGRPLAAAARKPDEPSEMKLVDSVPEKVPSRIGAAGFDPYASDAGYSKPHSWERIDHD
jgi:hypothetical protein